MGRKSRDAVKEVIKKVLAVLGAGSKEIFFLRSGTGADGINKNRRYKLV